MWSCDQSLVKKVRKCWGLIPSFLDVTEENLVGGVLELFAPPPPPSPLIQNRVKVKLKSN